MKKVFPYPQKIHTHLCKCVDGVPRVVRGYKLVRLEAPDCPLDPLIFVNTPPPYGHFYLTIVGRKLTKWPYGVGMVHIFKKVAIWCGSGDIDDHHSRTI